MPDQPSSDSLTGLVIYDGAELIFDGDDPATYIVCHTADDIQAAFATLNTGADS